ncbi:hypothetical protein CEXT_511801 [Caerostris extrusa]|uniref:Uncharacterized protein n=1 Tax=Caerostris extrusa TaxID=172846 RepID=A0AAV4M9R8_CAEEX|nr:hypothetical protein CEXT_511801 [Caerostris extrusa]
MRWVITIVEFTMDLCGRNQKHKNFCIKANTNIFKILINYSEQHRNTIVLQFQTILFFPTRQKHTLIIQIHRHRIQCPRLVLPETDALPSSGTVYHNETSASECSPEWTATTTNAPEIVSESPSIQSDTSELLNENS